MRTLPAVVRTANEINWRRGSGLSRTSCVENAWETIVGHAFPATYKEARKRLQLWHTLFFSPAGAFLHADSPFC